MNFEDSLETLGITRNEADVYIFLLSQGKEKAQHLPPLLGMDKSSCYRALKSLEKQGLIRTTGSTRSMVCEAQPATVLQDKITAQKANLEASQRAVALFTDEIEKQSTSFFEQHSIRTFRGSEGYKQWLEVRLQEAAAEKTEILEFVNRQFARDFFDGKYAEYFEGYIARRVANGTRLRQLDNTEGDLRHYIDKSSKKRLKEVRRHSGSQVADGIFSIYGSSVGYFITRGNEHYGVSIRDAHLASIHEAMFDMAWELGEKV